MLEDFDKKSYEEQIKNLNLLIYSNQLIYKYDEPLNYAKNIEKIILLMIEIYRLPEEELLKKTIDSNSTIQEFKFIDSIGKYEQTDIFSLSYAL